MTEIKAPMEYLDDKRKNPILLPLSQPVCGIDNWKRLQVMEIICFLVLYMALVNIPI